MTEPKREYMAYLLRLWQVRAMGTTGWRASLESPRTGECQGFARLDDLFLRRQTGAQSDADDAKERTQ
jgi:hypothetical protein